MSTHDQQIAGSVAFKGAIDLTVALIKANGATSADDAFATLDALVIPCLNALLGAQGVNNVAQAFPGTQFSQGNPDPFPAQPNVVQFPQQQAPAPAPVQYAPQQQYVPAPGPAAIPGAQGQSDDALWNLFFQDPSAWYDNRAGKQNPKAPDFRHKTQTDPANPQYKLSLWVNRAPAWAKQRLGVS